jgi:Uncharacterized conserved protein
MSIIVTPDDPDGVVANFYAEDVADQGYVATHTKVMSVNPEAMTAWRALVRAIAMPMGGRRFELVTLAAALGTRSVHCRLAHGRKSLKFIEENELVRIARDYRDAGLSDAEVAMMEFAERVSTNAPSMTDADSIRLRELGFSDREIVDIALAAAARNYYSRAIQSLAVEVDELPGLGDELRDALVEGIG